MSAHWGWGQHLPQQKVLLSGVQPGWGGLGLLARWALNVRHQVVGGLFSQEAWLGSTTICPQGEGLSAAPQALYPQWQLLRQKPGCNLCPSQMQGEAEPREQAQVWGGLQVGQLPATPERWPLAKSPVVSFFSHKGGGLLATQD